MLIDASSISSGLHERSTYNLWLRYGKKLTRATKLYFAYSCMSAKSRTKGSLDFEAHYEQVWGRLEFYINQIKGNAIFREPFIAGSPDNHLMPAQGQTEDKLPDG